MNDIEIQVPNGILSVLDFEQATNINPIIEARNKQINPLIAPKNPPIKIVNRISPRPSTSFFSLTSLTSKTQIIK